MSSRIAVIGGGITGLAAVHELRSQGHDEVVLLEAGETFGGKIRTSEFLNRSVDEGGDAFLARVPWGYDLCAELGLADQLTSPAARRAFIWADGDLHPLPSPNVLGVPLDPSADAGSLLSAEAVEQLTADVNREEPDPVRDNDTVGSLVRRRLGDEVFEKIVGPLLGAINAGDMDTMSLAASAPQLAAAATNSPSLINGLLDLRSGADPDAPVFWTLPGGLGTLVDALVSAHEGYLRAGSNVVDIARKRKSLKIHVSDEDTETAGAVILTTPAFIAGPLVSEWSQAASAYAEIDYVGVALATLAYRQEDVELIAGGSGFLVPRSQSPIITACSWSSSKWSHLDDGEHVILRVSLGHAGADAVLKARDEDLLGTVKRDLSETMGISAEPRSARLTRWPRSFPQYTSGHPDRVDRLRSTLHPQGIFPAGAALDGIGIPACIKSGRDAAQAALASLPQ